MPRCTRVAGKKLGMELRCATGGGDLGGLIVLVGLDIPYGERYLMKRFFLFKLMGRVR